MSNTAPKEEPPIVALSVEKSFVPFEEPLSPAYGNQDLYSKSEEIVAPTEEPVLSIFEAKSLFEAPKETSPPPIAHGINDSDEVIITTTTTTTTTKSYK